MSASVSIHALEQNTFSSFVILLISAVVAPYDQQQISFIVSLWKFFICHS